jgi:hypothetical protein
MHTEQEPSMHPEEEPSMHPEEEPSMHTEQEPSMHLEEEPSMQTQQTPKNNAFWDNWGWLKWIQGKKGGRPSYSTTPTNVSKGTVNNAGVINSQQNPNVKKVGGKRMPMPPLYLQSAPNPSGINIYNLSRKGGKPKRKKRKTVKK